MLELHGLRSLGFKNWVLLFDFFGVCLLEFVIAYLAVSFFIKRQMEKGNCDKVQICYSESRCLVTLNFFRRPSNCQSKVKQQNSNKL